MILVPCSSSPLRGPRNLRGIFEVCALFPVVLLSAVGLVLFYWDPRCSDVLLDLRESLRGLRWLLVLPWLSSPRVARPRSSGLDIWWSSRLLSVGSCSHRGLPRPLTILASFQPQWCLVCGAPYVCRFGFWSPREFWLRYSAAPSQYYVPTIFRLQVDGISCTDSSVA